MRKKIIIYNLDRGGHYSEYINYIIRFLDNQDLDVVFYLHKELKGQILEAQNVNFINRDIKKISLFYRQSMKGLGEYTLLQEIIDKEKATDILFMNIDAYFLLLGLWNFFGLKTNVSGIYFQPYIYQENGIAITKKWVKKIWYYLKLKLVGHNRNINSIFILNDISANNYLNKLIGLRSVFKYLPDPINFDNSLDISFSIDKVLNFTDGRKLFLIFGCIEKKKNIENILEAISLLTDDEKERVGLLIIGEASGDYKRKITDIINAFVSREVKVEVKWVFGYFSKENMDSLFHQIDFVLIPYINFFASSGVLGWAAKYGKPVLVPDKGLMERLVREYNLGLCVNPYSVKEIKNGMAVMLSQEKKWKMKNDLYVKERSVENFCKILLEEYI